MGTRYPDVDRKKPASISESGIAGEPKFTGAEGSHHGIINQARLGKETIYYSKVIVGLNKKKWRDILNYLKLQKMDK